ncbi:MAG: AHH domain-containing protein [Saprospiraceae bacterium]|nr:AHH domain-containing protein [Saprospiraceae bacterium]
MVSSLTEEEKKIIVPVIPAWEKAIPGYAQSGKEIIVVPLQGDSLITKATNDQANVVMLLSKDSINAITGQLLMYHADSAYFAAHSNNLSLADFSGEFLFFDLDYNYQYGCITANGVPTEIIDTVTVTMKREGELEDRGNEGTEGCIAYSELNVYCWTVRECCPLNGLDCVVWVETFLDCETTGGGSGGGGDTGGGWGSGGTGTGGGPLGPSPQTLTQFLNFITQNVQTGIFPAGLVLPPGFTPELALQLQQFYQENGLTQGQYYHLLANPSLIPLLLNFCIEFPTPDNGTVTGETQGGNDPHEANDETQLCKYLQNIVFGCFIDSKQGKWLANSTEDIFRMHKFLESHQWDVASIQAMQWYAKANTDGVFPHFTADDEIIPPGLIAEFVINAALFRTECQQGNGGVACSDWEVFSVAAYRTGIGYVHTALDLCGLIPVGGEPCDLINGVIYTFEGELMNATLSFSATLPIVGWFATGAKYAGITVLFNGISHSLPFKKVGNLIDFGNRDNLRKILGITNTMHEAHHIVPWELAEHELAQHAGKGNFHMNHPNNGIELERFRADPGTGVHAYHPAYNNKVRAKMTELWQKLEDHYGTGLVPVSVARQKLIELENNIRNHIDLNPTVKINNLTLNGVNVPSVP